MHRALHQLLNAEADFQKSSSYLSLLLLPVSATVEHTPHKSSEASYLQPIKVRFSVYSWPPPPLFAFVVFCERKWPCSAGCSCLQEERERESEGGENEGRRGRVLSV